MSDKLNLLTSNIIRFVAGERPTADKFNAMNLYYTRAVDNICRAIGDMHDRSVDSPLSPAWNPLEADLEGRPLDIVNLARLIGPASNLNPKMFGTENKVITERFSKDFIDENREISLKYTPTSNLLLLFRMEGQNQIDGFSVNLSYTFINDRTIILSDNVVVMEGEELEIRYVTAGGLGKHGGINYLGAGFNTIPDPNEATGLTSVEIVDLPDNQLYDYKITLSSRRIEAQQSGSHNLESSDISQYLDEYNNNVTYSLPEWWQSKFNLGGVGSEPTVITPGLVYLKNINTGEIYLTAEYAANDLGFLYVRNATLCLDNEHRLILAGTDITTSIDDLRNKMFNHRHDGSFGEPFIRIQDLIGKYVTGEFGPSSIPGNEFPMYLHRKGYQVDDNVRNGNNAMLGDIFMTGPGFSENDSVETQFVSNKIIFGTSGAHIHRLLGTLLIRNQDPGDPNDVINVGRGNISLQAVNNIILGAQNNEITSSQNTKLDQTNLISNSTNNTDINSNNETHLQINDSDVITLKKNAQDTTITGPAVVGFEDDAVTFSSYTRDRVWAGNDRKVISQSQDIVKKDYQIIDFEPTTSGASVVPTGILTQYDMPDAQANNNFLFVTNMASVYVNGELKNNVCSHYPDRKGRTFHQLEVGEENFILNYKKKITKRSNELNADAYGVWNQQYELEGDSSDIESYNGKKWLGANEDEIKDVNFCFGGSVYSTNMSLSEESGGFNASTSSEYCLSFRFEEYDTGLFDGNKDSYSILNLNAASKNWSKSGPIQATQTYYSVDIDLISNFNLIGNRELLTRIEDGVINDFKERLLQEINYSWGIRVKYNDNGVEKISWLVGKPHDYTNEVFGLEYDYEWRWQAARNYEFDLKLKINPRRLFKATVEEVLSEKENYSFEAIWRPYNYTRPSLKPTDINLAVSRITISDPSDGGWKNTNYNYILLSGDYEEEKYPDYIYSSEQECIDQRVPVGADIDFLIEARDLHNPDYKKLCPISFGVLNGDYYPGNKGTILETFQIHADEEETKYCRAASVGGSKQSIVIARNLNFEEGVSCKNFIINTKGGEDNKIDSSFLFNEYFIAIVHDDIFYDPDHRYLHYRRGINTVEKPNFLLNYHFVNNELATFSLSFNGRDGSADLGFEDNYLKNKVINISDLISRNFTLDVWKENYLQRYTSVDIKGEDSNRFYRSEMISGYWKYYGIDSEVKARLNTQKNWIDIARPRSQEAVDLVNGSDHVNPESYWNNFMPYIIQALFVGAYEADNSGRMPFTLINTSKEWDSYVRDIFFDVVIEVNEKYNSHANHLDIDVRCNYIIKKHSLKAKNYSRTPSLWSKKGVLEFPSFTPKIFLGNE